MSYEGEERKREHQYISERIAIVETRMESVERKLEENTNLLTEIKETSIKMKTLIGAVSFVISGLWLAITTFKDSIVGFLSSKP